MSKTSLIISKAELTEAGLLIRSMSIIDGASGEKIRIAKITPELLNFLLTLEIGLDDYLQVQKAKKLNPELTKLIETFKLYKNE
jgi:hypothetical protein